MNLRNIISGLPGYAKDAWPNVVVWQELKKLWQMQTSDNNYYLLYSLIANIQVLNTTSPFVVSIDFYFFLKMYLTFQSEFR